MLHYGGLSGGAIGAACLALWNGGRREGIERSAYFF